MAIEPGASHSIDDDFDPFGGGELDRVVATTESQREVWLATRFGREASLAYNQVVSLRLTGALQRAELDAAIAGLLDRHEALRATLGVDGMELLIARSVDLPLALIDLSGLDATGQAVAIEHEWVRSVEEPFDLVAGPLLRVVVLTLGALEHRLVIAAHHIICDGWSLGVIAQDLAVLYARARGLDNDALPPADRFSDYAAREAGAADSPALAAAEAYWLSRFPAEIPRLTLPLDHARPAVRSFASRRVDRQLDTAFEKALRQFANGAGASLFALLAGSFATLLSRITGQDDIVLGVPSAGQSRTGMHQLVGHCVNLLPIRFPLDSSHSALELLATSKTLLLDALEHQDYTFGTLLRKLRVDRDAGRVPLVSVMFNLDRAIDGATPAVAGIVGEPVTVPRHFEAFELFLNMAQGPDGLRIECQYNADLFDAATIRYWLGSYEALLRGLIARPQDAIALLPVIDDEQQRALAGWNHTALAHDRSRRVHELVDARARATPRRVALVADGQPMRFDELRVRSNRLAHMLRARGLARGGFAGLCVERGPEMLIALLAILKTGAAYVPLDPGYPAQRLAQMASDAGLAMLVTQATLRERLDLPTTAVVEIDADAGMIAALPDTDLPDDDRAARPDDPAYLIYTSGSTGTPKAAMIPHRAVVNFLEAMTREPGLAEDDTLVAVTTLSFDIAVLELLLPLTVGARLVLATGGTNADGRALRRLLESSGATVMQATPSTWHLLLDAGWQGAAGFRVLIGGEPLRADLAGRLLERAGEVWNLYGPTETTVWSTCWKLRRDTPGIAIGTPIANTIVHVVDLHGNRCPIGVPGEICIGGEGVALGYLKRPELTARCFVDDPFAASAGDNDGARMYRTGDRGRWRHDGVLEHLGRLDRQIKIRGYRIEPGEIEARLALHPDVERCVVVVREDRPGDQRIVGYMVPRGVAQSASPALRSHLQACLPEAMLPQHLVWLDALPLLPNGKIDRSALPPPERAPVQEDHVAPRSDTELALAQIWAEVLGVPQVGVHETFFELGGHSLLALQLINRIEQRFQRAIRLSTLFEAPSVSRLAALLSGETIDQPASCAVAIKGEGARAPLFFVSGWGGAIIGFSALAAELDPQQPLYVLDTTVFGSATHPVTTLEDVAAQMALDMRRVQPEGPYHLCGFSQGGKIVYEMAQQLARSGETVGLLALMDCDAPGYPAVRAPLPRIAMHLRHMLKQGVAHNLAYVGSRLRYFHRHWTGRDRSLFDGDASVAGIRAAQAIQASADQLTKAWEAYTPSRYEGRMVLITSAIREFRASLIDDDPLLGWNGLIGAGIVLRSMDARHLEMIDPGHAPALAALLSEFLEKPAMPRPRAVSATRDENRALRVSDR